MAEIPHAHRIALGALVSAAEYTQAALMKDIGGVSQTPAQSKNERAALGLQAAIDNARVVFGSQIAF